MPAPLGNDNAKKLKDKGTKDKVYKDYCDWLAKGKMAKSWYYESEELTLTYKTIENYISEDVDFPPIKKEIAICKGYQIWESICEEGAKGERDVNTPMIQMLMRNKFGWDAKEDKDTGNDDQIIIFRESEGVRLTPREEEERAKSLTT